MAAGASVLVAMRRAPGLPADPRDALQRDRCFAAARLRASRSQGRNIGMHSPFADTRMRLQEHPS